MYLPHTRDIITAVEMVQLCVPLCTAVHPATQYMRNYVVDGLLVSLLVFTAIFRHTKLSSVIMHGVTKRLRTHKEPPEKPNEIHQTTVGNN